MTGSIARFSRVWPPTLGGRPGVALLLLRIVVGAAFWFHGTGKVAHVAAFAAQFQLPYGLTAFAAYSEVTAALLLIVGLLTPVAALCLATTMVVALAKLIPQGVAFVNPGGGSWESAAFYLVASAALILAGPGHLSIDAFLMHRTGRFAMKRTGQSATH